MIRKMLEKAYYDLIKKYNYTSQRGGIAFEEGIAYVDFDGHSASVKFVMELEKVVNKGNLSSLRTYIETDILIDNDYISVETLEEAIDVTRAQALKIAKGANDEDQD